MNIYQQGGGFLQNSRAPCRPVALKNKISTSKKSSQKICDTLQGGALLSPNYLSQYVEIKIVELYHCQCKLAPIKHFVKLYFQIRNK